MTTTDDTTSAILESLFRDRIVTVEDRPGVRAELSALCDGEAEAFGLHEFWGRDEAGDRWRVHVCIKPRAQ